MLDVDGVLVGGPRWDHALTQDLGIARDDLMRVFFEPMWDDVVKGKRDLLPTLASCLTELPTSVTAEDLVAYWMAKDAQIVEAVLADVRTARKGGMPVYLTTNQEHVRAAYLMDTMGLGDEVDGIIYSAQAGYRKPQPEFFVYAKQATGFSPEDMFLVDDRAPNIEAARKSGWRAAHWDGETRLSALLHREIEKDLAK